MTVHAQRVFASDVRRLGHVSRGGDVAFKSRPILGVDMAHEAAQVLPVFTGAVVRR
jgi:hypothetical protein